MNSAWHQRWPLLVAALWWGGVSALGFMAVPMLFAHFGNPVVAGPMAAKLFQLLSWLSVASSTVLLLWGRSQRRQGRAGNASWALLPWLLLGALAGLLQEFGVAEKILTARSTGANLRLWHSLGSLMVALQWFSALRALWWLAGRSANSTVTAPDTGS